MHKTIGASLQACVLAEIKYPGQYGTNKGTKQVKAEFQQTKSIRFSQIITLDAAGSYLT